MDWTEYQQNFSTRARLEGRPPSFVEKCLTYARVLFEQNLPIIYDPKHLGELLGYDHSTLIGVIQSPKPLYVTYFIPKRKFGYRRIDTPLRSLMEIQLWILERILNQCPPHNAATAFTKKRSIKTNALPHIKQERIISLDVRDFFSSIRDSHVMKVFSGMGYSKSVSAMLTSLTTLNQSLPQGAPTSPAISNLVMVGIDQALFRYALKSNLSYTRYADDITFSGRLEQPRSGPGRLKPSPVSRQPGLDLGKGRHNPNSVPRQLELDLVPRGPGTGLVIAECRTALRRCGLYLNESKTRVMLTHQQQEVTGVVVNQKIQANRSMRRRLRQEIYYIERYGFESHDKKCPSLYGNRIDHLRGLAEFIRFLNPNDRDAKKAISILGKYGVAQSKPLG